MYPAYTAENRIISSTNNFQVLPLVCFAPTVAVWGGVTFARKRTLRGGAIGALYLVKCPSNLKLDFNGLGYVVPPKVAKKTAWQRAEGHHIGALLQECLPPMKAKIRCPL